ncbi:MAG TPA: zinc carboxypeptidase, partial [Bacteroidetes bacterium]|nr:zinc carboxypeptidase [Bacteroidota bacterium]
RNYYLLDILRRHQIDVYELGKSVQAGGKTFDPASSYVVPMNQKQFRLINALFEIRTTFTDSLFYDVSSWTLPLAFNLPYAELKAPTRDLLGKKVDRPIFPKGDLVTASNPVAYAFEWKPYYAPRALYRLQKAGIKTRVATKQFEATTPNGKQRFDYGAIMVPVGIQRDKAELIAKTFQTIAQEDGIHCTTLSTGMSIEGIDLGSSSFEPLQMPRVMLVVGQGVSATDIGEAWHLLDQRFAIEVSLIETQSIGRVELGRYTTIVMADGSYASVDSAGMASLRRWIENGGTLVAMEQAAEWAVNNRL